MSFLGKNYTFYKQENFDGFLKQAGLPEDKIQAVCSYISTHRIEKDGDTYTYYSQNIEGPKEIKFKSGEEFDEVRGASNYPIKTKYVVDGNTLTQTASTDRGNVISKREYSDDELVVTITADNWDGVAKRFYKA